MIKGVIRRLHRADGDAVDSLIRKTRVNDSTFGGGWGNPSSLTKYLESGSSLGFFSAEHNLLGFILCRRYQWHCDIDLVATDDSCWRAGVMKSLFGELFHQAVAQEIWVEVASDNFRARSLYEKIGFSVVGARPNYYGSNRQAVLYSCSATSAKVP